MLLGNNQPQQKLNNFFQTGRQLQYEKGEIVLRAGDVPQGVYLIQSGYMKVYSLAKDGTEHTHVLYEPGDIFPVMWIFKDAVRNVYYQTTAQTKLWIVSKSEFKKFIASHSDVAMLILEQVTDMFRLYAGRIDNLMYSNSYERTAYRILSLMDRLGDQIEGGWVINAPVTHQDIASSVNLTRETVSRCMQRLKNKGFIATDHDRHIIVKNPAGLMKIIGEEEAVGMWPQLEPYRT